MLNAPASKNFPLPIILHPPLPGRFVERMQYAPTLTDENRASNKYAFAPVGPFGGRMRYAPTGDIENGAFFPLSRLFLFGLTGYHLGGSLERGVPFGSELADKRFAQETVGWYAQLFA